MLFRKKNNMATTEGIIVDMCLNPLNYNLGLEKSWTMTNDTKISVSVGAYFPGFNICYPVYEYVVDGVTYRRAGAMGYHSWFADKKIGKTVTVFYDPKNPKEAKMKFS